MRPPVGPPRSSLPLGRARYDRPHASLTVSPRGFRRRLRQPEGRTCQQLPAAVLFLPDLQDADLGVGDFAVEFAFRHPQMTRYDVVANDRDCEVRKSTDPARGEPAGLYSGSREPTGCPRSRRVRRMGDGFALGRKRRC